MADLKTNKTSQRVGALGSLGAASAGHLGSKLLNAALSTPAYSAFRGANVEVNANPEFSVSRGRIKALKGINKSKAMVISSSVGVPGAYMPGPITERGRKALKKFVSNPTPLPPSSTATFGGTKNTMTAFRELSRKGSQGVVFLGGYGNNLQTAAHELTHARAGKSALGKAWIKGSIASSRFLAPTAGIIMASSDPDSRTSKAALVTSLALHAPLLVEEARANIGATKSLRRMGLSEKALKLSRKAGRRAFATYLVPVAGTAVGVAGTRSIMKYLKNRKNR